MYIFKYKELAQALYESLNADPFYIAIIESLTGGEEEKREALLRYLDYSMIEAEIYGKLFIPQDHNNGVSIWTKPLSSDLESKRNMEKKAFIKHYLGTEALNIYVVITSFMSVQIQGLIPDNSWYLSILGVRPEFQGRGFGADLVNSVLKETDKYLIYTYLETFNSKSIDFYRKLGYQVLRQINEPVTNSPYWILARV